MKKLKEELKYGKKGITLISLVVTIIVLLILAGVTIATLTGDNGILTRALEAKNKTEEAQEKESLELAVTSSQMEDVNTLEITEEKLSDAIKQQFGNNKNFSITDNGDGSFLVSMNDTQRMYYIDETGKIIDKILKISTADELKSFRDDVNSGNTYEDWYVYLANDITLDINEEWEPIGLFLNSISSPDDNSNKAFKGVFDGKDCMIDEIYINTADKSQGLFGLVNNGIIKNVRIGNNSVITGGNYTGGLIGMASNETKVNNCSNGASITCSGVASGGIVGQLTENGLISHCYNIGKVTSSNNHVGGICGIVDKNSSIEECYNTSIVSGLSQYVGGIIGALQDGCILQNCYNTRYN